MNHRARFSAELKAKGLKLLIIWHAGNVKCEVVGFMRKIMNGGYYPWAPRSGAGYVDIDDVAAAHTLAMLTHKASGRCGSSCFWP